MRISDWSSDVCSSDLQTQDQGEDTHDFEAQVASARRRRPHGICSDLGACAGCQWWPDFWSRGAAHSSPRHAHSGRSEEHTSELQSLMRISYAVFCLKKKNINIINPHIHKSPQTHHKTHNVIKHNQNNICTLSTTTQP